MNKSLKEKLKTIYRDFDDRIADAIVNNPEKSYDTLAEELQTSKTVLYRVARERGIKRPHGSGAAAWGKGKRNAVRRSGRKQRHQKPLNVRSNNKGNRAATSMEGSEHDEG